MLNLDPFRHTKVYQEAFEEGCRENRKEFVVLMLQTRFGELDQALAAIIDPLVKLPPAEVVPLLFSPREELIARFGPSAVWVQETTAVEEQQ